MTDIHLSALEEAAKAWANSLYASPAERIQMAKDLHSFRVFSLTQLAKTVRLTTSCVSIHCKKSDTTGGRFQAPALSVLVYLRRAYLKDGKVNKNLVQAAIDEGCSASCISVLVGINYTAIYRANQARFE